MEMYFIDSNTWCYYFNKSSKEHEAIAKEVEKVLEEKIIVNTVVIMEVAHYLVKSLGPIKGKNKMEVFLSFHTGLLNLITSSQRVRLIFLQDTLM